MHTKRFAVLAYGLAAFPAFAGAQPPLLTYDSAYTGYRPYREAQPASWREVNDEAARAGGHAGIFGTAAQAHGAASPPPDEKADGSSAPTPPHGGARH